MTRMFRFLPLLAAGLMLGAPSAVDAQGREAAETRNVEVDPITCSWRTGSPAVRVGETFRVVLTCGVLDTVATTVVPDEARLDPGVLQLQPFEIVSGQQAPDLRTANRRYFQYEYVLRYVGEEIGTELRLPSLTLTYRVQNRVQANAAAIESREREYVLPSLVVRVTSLVPQMAPDIRESQPTTFAEVDARRFRANLLSVVAWALYGLGGVIAVWALVQTARRQRRATKVVPQHLSDSAVLRAAARELDAVRRAHQTEGWTDALAARALAAVRVAAAYDSGMAVPQVPARGDVTLLTGQLRVGAGFPRMGAVVVSGSGTAVTLQQTRERLTGDERRAVRLGEMASALDRFSDAVYGPSPGTLDLDDALATGAAAVAGVRRDHSWLARTFRGLRAAVLRRTGR